LKSQAVLSQSIYTLFLFIQIGYEYYVIPRHFTSSSLSSNCAYSATDIKSHFFSLYSYFCPLNHDSSVGIALGYGLDDGGSRVRFPVGAGNFSLHYHVQNGSGAHPDPFPMGTRISFPGIKADWA
jgi:hypothetical protein